MLYDEVMLIRCRPDARSRNRVRRHLESRRDVRRLLFLHGPGLDWAGEGAALESVLDVGQSATLMLCSAGWRRRHAGQPPEGFEPGSLVQFWDAADRADSVISFGALGE